MKTIIRKLKFGILLAGIVVFIPCDNHALVVSASGTNSIHNTIPSVTINMTKYAMNKMSKYLKDTPESNKVKGLACKKPNKEGRSYKIMPITIGVAGARLVSSNNL
jgi:hypothetical protein